MIAKIRGRIRVPDQYGAGLFCDRLSEVPTWPKDIPATPAPGSAEFPRSPALLRVGTLSARLNLGLPDSGPMPITS